VDIAVDGGIGLESGRQALDAGANVLGAASAIFSQPDPAEAARALRDLFADRAGGS
jgi:ribulose-phosphate 3-epimerase